MQLAREVGEVRGGGKVGRGRESGKGEGGEGEGREGKGEGKEGGEEVKGKSKQSTGILPSVRNVCVMLASSPSMCLQIVLMHSQNSSLS